MRLPSKERQEELRKALQNWSRGEDGYPESWREFTLLLEMTDDEIRWLRVEVDRK